MNTCIIKDTDLAAKALRDGKLVAFATETVYGLGADATNGEAVAGIYEAKGRPSFNPLIVHTADVASARELGQFSDTAIGLAEAFWPGPLTLVVPRRPDCTASSLVSAGLDSIALRVPSAPGAQALLKAAGVPVAAPSANRSGHISPTTSAHVMASLDGRIWGVLEGGACDVGLESTIVSCLEEPPVLLRPGGISAEEIEQVLGARLEVSKQQADAPVAPGQLQSHYAPRAKVRLNVVDVRAGETYLGFGPKAPKDAANLSPTGNLREAAANLFAMLHALDGAGADTIAVAPIPHEGLGAAINDRLTRAAAPRQKRL